MSLSPYTEHPYHDDTKIIPTAHHNHPKTLHAINTVQYYLIKTIIQIDLSIPAVELDGGECHASFQSLPSLLSSSNPCRPLKPFPPNIQRHLYRLLSSSVSLFLSFVFAVAFIPQIEEEHEEDSEEEPYGRPWNRRVVEERGRRAPPTSLRSSDLGIWGNGWLILIKWCMIARSDSMRDTTRYWIAIQLNVEASVGIWQWKQVLSGHVCDCQFDVTRME